MVDKNYKCQHCGHDAVVQQPDDWKQQRMYLDCPSCGERVGMKMQVNVGANIQKFGNQKGITTYEEIFNRPR